MFRGEKAPRPDQRPITPEEIGDIFIGTFPLSPGVMTGHYLIPSIWRRWDAHRFQNQTPIDLFGTDSPQAPFVGIPNKHRTELTSPQGAIRSFWTTYLDRLFNDRYEGELTGELVNQLIGLTAKHDLNYLENRIAKNASQMDDHHVVLSYLKTLAIDQVPLAKYQFYSQNPFYKRLFNEMRSKVSFALSQPHRQDDWIEKVNELKLHWDQHIPKSKFFK